LVICTVAQKKETAVIRMDASVLSVALGDAAVVVINIDDSQHIFALDKRNA
jgi:hypothetical protein